MSDAEDDVQYDEFTDDENELDELDQNDDIDADALDQDADAEDDDDEEEEFIYGPLRTLKIRDGDHITIRVVPPETRRTSNVICDNEFAEATGIRASQIERGAPVFTNVDGMTDPIKMAHKEFYDRKNPLLLERIVEQRGSVYYVEHWRVRDMTFPIRNK